MFAGFLAFPPRRKGRGEEASPLRDELLLHVHFGWRARNRARQPRLEMSTDALTIGRNAAVERQNNISAYPKGLSQCLIPAAS
jgi:hypothetical protein